MHSSTICDIQPNTTQRGVGAEGDCGVGVTPCTRHAYMQPFRQRRVLGFLTHHILPNFGTFNFILARANTQRVPTLMTPL